MTQPVTQAGEAALQRSDIGVLLVRDADGLILRSNARAAEMLGLTVADLEGHRLTDVTGDFAAFAAAAHGPSAVPPGTGPSGSGASGTGHRVDLPGRAPVGIRRESLGDGQTAIQVLPVAAAAQDSSEGNAQASAQAAALGDALRRQVAENAELRSAATLGNRARIMATAAVIGIFLFVGGWSWMATQLNVRELDTVLGLDGGGTRTGIQTMEVATQPLTNAINLTGTLEPGQVVNLVAPFAGQVKQISFTYGARVAAGDTLLALDTSEVEVQLRDAETALIQARQKLEEVKHWSASPAVSSARRSLEQARMSLSQAQQNYEQTQTLFQKGIVSQQERDSSETTFRNARISVVGAEEAVKSAMQQGDRNALEVAQLTFENARFKYDSLRRKVAQAEIKAPVSGIVLRPVDSGSSTRSGGESGTTSVSVGAPVADNQILLSVGDLETLSISSDVSEFNISQVHPGLKVNVTSDALPGVRLEGEVTSVSSQASSSGGSMPTFGTTVTIKNLAEEARRDVRVGMSANLQVVIYQNPTAIVVPFTAVLGGPGDAQVMVVEAAGARPEPVRVEVGERTATGIEITSGLKPGQTIVTNASHATAMAGG